MGIDGSITSSSCKVFTLTVRNVLAVSLDVSFGKSEVEDENFVGSLVQPNAEVIWLDVPMNEVPVVHILNPGDHLIDEHEDCLEGELPEGLIKERFEGWSHKIHDQNVVLT